MKIAIITDQHFGVKKGSKIYHDYFKQFYDEIFFPTLEKENITTLIDMGDTFDNRKIIDLWSVKWAQNNYYDRLEKMNINVYTVIGNHTAYYKNTNEVNTIEIALGKYKNIIPIPKTIEYNIEGLNILFVPWINEDNQVSTFDMINSSKSKVVMGHLELSGFSMYKGMVQENGLDPNIFSKFSKVFSGHYHTRSNNGKIYYLGNPYQIYWNDCNDERGFHIFDTETLKVKEVNNPFELFKKIYYSDTDPSTFDFTCCENKYIKLIVERKTDQLNYDTFLDKLINSNCHEVKIVESFSINSKSIEMNKLEDTISILNTYVEDSEISLNKQTIMNYIETIYKEACEVD